MRKKFDDCLDWFSTLDEHAEREFKANDPDISQRREFQRDRDRIIASKAFCRLDGKAQVFYADSRVHIRNRLTHSLGVRSIADSIARKLKLNLDLTEAIALSHDLGHTPYGHIGERVLNQIMNGCINIHGVHKNLTQEDMGFKHNWQGYRIVSELANYSYKFPGLNLTKQTIWGIVHHTGLKYSDCKNLCLFKLGSSKERLTDSPKNCDKSLSVAFYTSPHRIKRPECEKGHIPLDDKYWTPEAMVVSVADEIDQRIHDVLDALEFELVGLKDITSQLQNKLNNFISSDMKVVLNSLLARSIKNWNRQDQVVVSRLIADIYIQNFVLFYKERMTDYIEQHNISNQEDYRNRIQERIVPFDSQSLKDDEFWKADEQFHKYLVGLILNCHKVQLADGRASLIIRKLFKAFITNPMQLPDSVIRRFACQMDGKPYNIVINTLADSEDERVAMNRSRSIFIDDYLRDSKGNANPSGYATLMRMICDFISGMTDQFAESYFHELYGVNDIMLEFK